MNFKKNLKTKKYRILRKKYPKFVFEKYNWVISDKDLKISFYFKIEPNIHFRPKIVINDVSKNKIKKIGRGVLNNLIFHLGLIEILSYWKATCSPEIEIKAGFLNDEQIKWWKDLIIKGMGQFFYENKIDFRKRNFLNIKTKTILDNYAMAEISSKRVMVPVGGGKDSIVTLEILKKAGEEVSCFVLNPTKAAHNIMKIATFPISAFKKGERNRKIGENIIVRRKIDKKLLQLNRKGFLNGHTPFSAYLAFLSILAATISGQK